MDLRDSFFDTLYNISFLNENFYFLMADMWAFSLDKFKKILGKRFINAGISEQNIISMAAGLAKSGKKVCVYTITPFITERCFEQIKVDLCCMNLPVMIVGIGAGFTYSFDGPTHQTLYDIAIMRTLPNMTIYSPSSPVINEYVAKLAYDNDGPSYIRLDKGDYPYLYRDRSRGAIEGGLIGPIKEGDVLIISTGTNVYTVKEVAKELYDMSFNVSYVDLYQIKPLNESRMVDVLLKYERIIVVEEHSPIGGIGSIISELMIDNHIYKPLKKISLPDEFCKQYGDRNWIRKQYGLDKDSIMKSILEFVG